MTPTDMLTILGGVAAIVMIPSTALYWMISKLATDIHELTNEIRSVNVRVARIEGAIANKDCCMIKDTRSQEKAE